MDRLTERDEFGNANIIVSDIVPKLQAELSNALTATLNRLAAYEDTGLTPAEIEQLKAENARLHKLVDNIECVMRGER